MKLSPSEAIYGFVAWLTTRDKIVTLSKRHDCDMMPDLIELFCEINGLEKPADDWYKKLKKPEQK